MQPGRIHCFFPPSGERFSSSRTRTQPLFLPSPAAARGRTSQDAFCAFTSAPSLPRAGQRARFDQSWATAPRTCILWTVPSGQILSSIASAASIRPCAIPRSPGARLAPRSCPNSPPPACPRIKPFPSFAAPPRRLPSRSGILPVTPWIFHASPHPQSRKSPHSPIDHPLRTRYRENVLVRSRPRGEER